MAASLPPPSQPQTDLQLQPVGAVASFTTLPLRWWGLPQHILLLVTCDCQRHCRTLEFRALH